MCLVAFEWFVPQGSKNKRHPRGPGELGYEAGHGGASGKD